MFEDEKLSAIWLGSLGLTPMWVIHSLTPGEMAVKVGVGEVAFVDTSRVPSSKPT